MKKIISYLLIAVLTIVSMTGCNENTETEVKVKSDAIIESDSIIESDVSIESDSEEKLSAEVEVEENVVTSVKVETPSKPQEVIKAPEPVVEAQPVASDSAPVPATTTPTSSSAIFTYEVFTKSNLSVEQLAIVLGGTPLQANAQDFYDMEQTYNVNALFAVAVACLESGGGAVNANVNNFFGFRGNNGWMSFATPREGIFYFGKLMNTQWYYGKTLEQVGVVYCNGDWAPYIKRLMNERWNRLS